jgi:hypothetical protein
LATAIIKHRNASRVALLALLISPAIVQADYTTDETHSLEWIVHSSDAIYLVRSAKPKQDEGSWSIVWERTLREPTDPSGSIIRAVEEAELFGSARDGDQWLVFVRTWENKPPNVFYRVNLSRPLESPWTAAINAEGTPLASKVAILKTVEDRLRLNRRLSDRERRGRERVDLGGPPSWHDGATRFSLEYCLGGFLVPINCDLWDNPSKASVNYTIIDEDLGLTGVVVPAHPEFYDTLLQAARHGDGSHDCNWAIANLINYPGPRTDKVLQDLIESQSLSRGLAQDVAWFFRYRYDLSDPLHRELVGHWQLLGHRERIDIWDISAAAVSVTHTLCESHRESTDLSE